MLVVLSIFFLSFLAGALCQDTSRTLPLALEPGATQECKACPYIGCVNKDFSSSNITGVCWTTGQAINNLTLWAKTSDDCYINEWDLKDPGDLKANLTYCGHVDAEITEVQAKTKYYTECSTNPYFDWEEYSYIAKWYTESVDLTLTCKHTADGSGVDTMFGDGTWFRTKYSYCFVHRKLLWPIENGKISLVRNGVCPLTNDYPEDDLPDCGPIPFLDTKQRNPDAAIARVASSPTVQVATKKVDQTPPVWIKKTTSKTPSTVSRRGLFNNTVVSDIALCTSERAENSTVVHRYPYGRGIQAQCGEYASDYISIIIFTTDYCWVKESDLDIMIEDGTDNIKTYLKYCYLYIDVEEWTDTDNWGCGVTVDC